MKLNAEVGPLHIPKTRLMPPQVVEKVLVRPLLVSRVRDALLQGGVTVLSAPRFSMRY